MFAVTPVDMKIEVLIMMQFVFPPYQHQHILQSLAREGYQDTCDVFTGLSAWLMSPYVPVLLILCGLWTRRVSPPGVRKHHGSSLQSQRAGEGREGRGQWLTFIFFFFSVYSAAKNQRCNLCGRRRQNLSLNLVTSTRGSPTTVSNHKALYSNTIGPLSPVVVLPEPCLVNGVPRHKNSLSKHNILQRDSQLDNGKNWGNQRKPKLLCDSTLRLGTRSFYHQYYILFTTTRPKPRAKQWTCIYHSLMVSLGNKYSMLSFASLVQRIALRCPGKTLRDSLSRYLYPGISPARIPVSQFVFDINLSNGLFLPLSCQNNC